MYTVGDRVTAINTGRVPATGGRTPVGRRKFKDEGGLTLFSESAPLAPVEANRAAWELRPVHDLRTRLKNIHNYIYANDRFKQHAKVFEELMKLLLVKLYDEKYDARQFYISADEQAALTDDTLTAFASRITQLFTTAIADSEIGGVFHPSDKLDLSYRVLAFAVSQLHDVSLLETDAKGTAFQAILGPQVRGEKGQFFTPDPVKRLIVSLIDPSPAESILDPACGSAGLLSQTIDHIRRKVIGHNDGIASNGSMSRKSRGSPMSAVHALTSRNVLGMEIDPTLVRVARLNMMLQGEGHSNVFAGNALSDWKTLAAASDGKLAPESVDIIVTNPPFGTKGKVDDPRILAAFPHVAGERKRQVPDILFIERIVQLLRPGGRAGIVLPYGDLANSSLSYVRDFIRSTCHLFATVSLPPPTFKPAENSVRAAVLFVRKWPKKERPKRYPTFRAISQKIGYDMHERVIYRKDMRGFYLDRQGRTIPPERAKDPLWLATHGIVEEDITDIIEQWKAFRGNFGKDYLW